MPPSGLKKNHARSEAVPIVRKLFYELFKICVLMLTSGITRTEHLGLINTAFTHAQDWVPKGAKNPQEISYLILGFVLSWSWRYANACRSMSVHPTCSNSVSRQLDDRPQEVYVELHHSNLHVLILISLFSFPSDMWNTLSLDGITELLNSFRAQHLRIVVANHFDKTHNTPLNSQVCSLLRF